jgi:hypothetical protein
LREVRRRRVRYSFADEVPSYPVSEPARREIA